MNLNYRKNLLLLGAGFTANFGGFLAKEMWAKIFSNPDLDQLPEVRQLFKDEKNKFDFENIFSIVMGGSKFSAEEKNEFEKIIVKTYIAMQQVIKQGEEQISDLYGVNREKFKEFLDLFLFDNNLAGACFTLNQDLFFEQKFKFQPFISKTKWFSQLRLQQCGGYKATYISTDPHVLPNQNELNYFIGNRFNNELNNIKHQHKILYMKLHGSLGWVSSEGRNRMIIGKNKKEDIEKEPLLNLYFQEFKKALNQDSVKLLVIGYSFIDEHVNECLVDAINNNKLKLYIISTEFPDTFQKRITHKYPYSPGTLNEIDNGGEKIWDSIAGYFPYKMKDIFPKDGSLTDTVNTLIKIFN